MPRICYPMSRFHAQSIRVIRTLAVLGLLAAGLGLWAVPARAQYFGQNKVVYENFRFQVLHTPHFNVYYYPEEEEGARLAARLAERWYWRHEQIFHHDLSGPQPLILYSSSPQFQETNVIAEQIGEGTGGVTEPLKRRIVLALAGPLRETDHVIGHELVHAFQYDLAKEGHNRPGIQAQAAEAMPLWFIEGMAEYFSLGPYDPNTAMWMREAARSKLPTIRKLDSPEYFPYRYGQALLAYLGGRYGNEAIVRLLRAGVTQPDFEEAIHRTLKIKPDMLSKAWHASLHQAYDSLLARTRQPVAYGPVLIAGKHGGGEMNVSPVLSPDGKELVFFSERDLFAFDLYLADAATGKVKKALFRMERNPSLESLEFIQSAGSWDPQSKRFAVSGVAKGRPLLVILNVETGKIERRIPFPKLGEILDPAWSPDGRYIAFSGITGGLSDLYLYDLVSDSLRRLTQDPYAEIQPAWSPDSKSLAFVTDRFTTKLADLDIGNYRLARMTLPSGEIEPLSDFPDANNYNPQWSKDGKQLYFLSDQNGIPNICCLDPEGGAPALLTNLYGGVSGITATSPALSIARSGNRLTYSAYEKGHYNIYSGDSLLAAKRAPADSLPADANPALLAPADAPGDSVFLANLRDPVAGLPRDTLLNSTPYRGGLSLVGASQLSLGGGVSASGTYLAGGTMLYWSDMLGNHNLATGLQVQTGGGNTDVAAVVGYENLVRRWIWGGVGQQIPYVTQDYASGYGTVNGEPALIEQTVTFKEIDRELDGFVAYPFSRALRAEFLAGYRNISFNASVLTQGTSLATGELIYDVTEKLPSPTALNLGTVGTALVYDYSYFGATSPILGQRWRLEASPNMGSIQWVDLLGDYRKYIMPVRKFTLAGRLLHYGRYGGGGEDSRLSSIFLGDPGLVRGYDSGSFSAAEAATDSTGYSPAFDRLLGSKVLIANAELRFPLFGVLGIGKGYYGILPVEAAGFYDAGVAWQSDHKAWFLGGDRRPVQSAGGALRINLMGFAVAEVDYVKPLDRPLKSWFWEFNLTPGF